MDKKKSFVIYENWALMLSQMPNEDAGNLIKKICKYKLMGEVDEEYSAVDGIFQMIKVALDADAEKYEEICKMRREQGSKGGKQKVANGKQKVANANQKVANGKQMGSKGVAKCSHTDTDTDTVTDTVTDTDTEKEREQKDISKIIPPKIEWVDEYCRSRNNTIDANRFCDYYESNGWKVGSKKMKDWKACVRTWESREKERQEETYKNNNALETRISQVDWW